MFHFTLPTDMTNLNNTNNVKDHLKQWNHKNFQRHETNRKHTSSRMLWPPRELDDFPHPCRPQQYR